MTKFDDAEPVTAPDDAVAWERCWESVLCLSGNDLSDEALFTEAKRLLRRCRASTADRGIDWFKHELEDAQVFVAEQIAADPADPDWRRIRALLAGAEAGLANCPDC